MLCREVSKPKVQVGSAQFIDLPDQGKKIAMFELAVEDGRVVIVDEKDDKLVPSAEISPEDLRAYGNN